MISLDQKTKKVRLKKTFDSVSVFSALRSGIFLIREKQRKGNPSDLSKLLILNKCFKDYQ